jgi:hypothetical protein
LQTGEDRAWEILTSLNPDDVCKRASVSFDKESFAYMLKSFGNDFQFLLNDKKISGNSPDSDLFLNKLGYFFRLSALYYLNNAKDVPLTNRLVKPSDLKDGQHFFRGTHVLPLDKIAEKYCNDTSLFIKKGELLGGEKLQYGDASLKLLPFPRVPVILIIWKTDEEFPARADLLFDSTCDFQLPIDIIWAIAMISILVML